ncbi:hybrid sensor histidine kinase/response regulator [Nitrospira sp. M1]
MPSSVLSSSFRHLPLKTQLFREQVAQLYALAPVGIIASCITSLILVFILWNVMAPSLLLVWVSSLTLINAIRGVLVFRYRRMTPSPEDISRWCHWFILGNLLSGLTWGAAGFFLYPLDSLPHEFGLIFVLGGMVAGSTAMHSALPQAFWAFSAPTAVPFTVIFFQHGDDLHVAMGLLSILFMVMMGMVARRNHLLIAKGITLQHENAQLLDHATTARDQLETMVKARTAELQASEARYRLLANNLTDVIWLMALDGRRFTYISPSVTSLLGFTPEEAMTHSLDEVLTPDSARQARAVLDEELRLESTGNADRFRSFLLELEHYRKDGSTVWAEVRGSLLRDERGQGIGMVGVTRDVTERKKIDEEKQRLEAQLLRSQKIEAVGTLAGGIAHDFNNFLTSVLGNIDLAQQVEIASSARAEFLTKAAQATLRAKDLTQQLLTFAKGGEPIKQLTYLDRVIKESSSFSLSGSAVACEYVFQPDLWPTDVDPGQMSQVIHNLVINAVEAMSNEGTITIRAENVLLPSKTLERRIPLPPGPYLKVSLCDTGPGIPDEQLPKIFDPYFTTKSEGHGLGLASAYSIMKKHEGLMTVESKHGIGTEFTLIFPAAPDAQVPSATEVVQTRKGDGRILVMDDDVHVRMVAGEILTHCGYQCELARDGSEAITLYRQAMQCGKHFSAVILDLTIPGSMGGKETLRRLQQIDPAVKAIVSSGYSQDPVMANYHSHGFQGVVRKPYSLEELSKVMYEVVVESSAT